MRKKTGFAHLLLALLLAASLSGCGETAAPERTAGTVTRETDAPVETPADAPAPEATAAPAEKPDLADTPAPAETLVPEISDATTPSPAPTVTPVPEATAAPDEDPGSYAEDVPVYTPVLDVLCDYLSRGKPWWENTAAGLTGISEMVSYLGEDAAQDLGYVITDLSGDGVPELAVCITSGDGSSGVVGNEVLCLYTWADGEPLLVLEGWARNSYHWLGGGRFFYRGSSGAVYSILGTYALSRDGRESKCEECWFTWPRDDDWSVIDYWYNQLGEMDPEVSEPWEGRDIWEIEEELASQVRDIELAPLSGYLASWRSRQAENAPLLSAYWPDQVPNAYPDYLLCSLAEGEAGAEVVFVAGETLSDLRLLALTMGEWHVDEPARFTAQDRYTLDELTPERPLAAKLTFAGDIPNNGVAFLDSAGTEHVYAVELSGKDGSLVLWEIETEG